jgi:uncharacterized protein YbaP (TraB family)
MRSLSALFAFAFCLCATISACAPRAPGPALWRLSDEDSTVWLFGTVHVLPPDLAWRTERIDNALASAQILVTETETGPESAPAFVALVQRYGAGPPERTLASLIASGEITPRERQAITSLARDLGIRPGQLEAARPWLAALQISLASAVRDGQSAEAGVEAALLQTARADGKALQTLETPEQQIRTLADLPLADELAFLRAAVRQTKDAPETIEALDRAWAVGDTRRLAELTERDIREAGPGVYEALIARRNAAWTTQIRALLAGHEDAFIAVGAAHLVGDESVIARLRVQGLHVEGP